MPLNSTRKTSLSNKASHSFPGDQNLAFIYRCSLQPYRTPISPSSFFLLLLPLELPQSFPRSQHSSLLGVRLAAPARPTGHGPHTWPSSHDSCWVGRWWSWGRSSRTLQGWMKVSGRLKGMEWIRKTLTSARLCYPSWCVRHFRGLRG